MSKNFTQFLYISWLVYANLSCTNISLENEKFREPLYLSLNLGACIFKAHDLPSIVLCPLCLSSNILVQALNALWRLCRRTITEG